MRLLILTTLFLGGFYLFTKKVEPKLVMDTVRTTASASRASRPAPVKKAITRQTLVSEEQASPEEITPEYEDETASTPVVSQAEKAQVEIIEEPSETDLEKGWQEELGSLISGLEPEYGEEMYNAYMAEKKNFQSGLDELVRGENRNEDIDQMIGELESRHEERVKEIFGTHYETIKENQTKYFESSESL